MKIVLKCFVFLALLTILTIGSIFISTENVENQSYAEYIPSNIDFYTDSDTFLYNFVQYDINDYKESYINYANAGLTNYPSNLYNCTRSVIVCEDYFDLSIIGDDPITKIIPRELFETRGEYYYIGKEYGYYITTYANTYDYYDYQTQTWETSISNYNNHSIVLVFDLATTPRVNDNYIDIEIKPLFELEYVYLSGQENYFSILSSFSETYCHLGHYNLQNTNLNYIIPTFKVDTDNCIEYSPIDKFYIKDVSFSGKLLNEQEMNYSINQNYNAVDEANSILLDKGSYFTRYDFYHQGYERINGEFTQEIIRTIALDVIELGLCYTGTLGNIYFTTDYGYDIISNIDYATSIDMVGFSQNEYYTIDILQNATDQDDEYGYILKEALSSIDNNNNIDNAIWYGCDYDDNSENDNYIKTTFTVSHSESGNAWYTRFIENIALNIVSESNPNGIVSIIKEDHIFLRDINYKPINMETINNAYILEEGTNYFSFTPEYTSDYQINCSTTSNISCEILDANDVAIYNGNGNNFTQRLLAGTTYHIKLSADNSEPIVVPFSIIPDVNTGSLIINGNDIYIKKINIANFDVKKFVTNNTNVDIIGLYTMNTNNELVSYVSFNTIIPYNTISYPLYANDYYILLENTSVSSQTINWSYSNTGDVGLNNNIDQLILDGNNYSYTKFEVITGGSYVFLASAENSQLSFKTISSSGALPGGSTLEDTYTMQFNPGIYYIGVKSDDIATITMSVEREEYAYQWEINGVKTYDQIYNLTRGTNNILKFYINGVLNNKTMLDENDFLNHYNGYSYNLNQATGNLNIYSYCPVDGSGFKVRARANEVNTTYNHYLTIVPKFNNAIEITGTINNNTQLIFNWRYQATITTIYYKITLGSNTKYYTISTSSGKTNGTIYPEDILSKMNTFTSGAGKATINIYQIDLLQANGTYYTYLTSGSILIDSRFNGGTGTTTDPFLINNIRNFINIGYASISGSNYTYKQTSNLNFSNASTPSNIALYGTYNGNNKSITGISISCNSSTIGGMFYENRGTIKNISSFSANITNTYTNNYSCNMGTIVGINYGTITGINGISGNLYANNTTRALIGGIVGYNTENANILLSSSTANITTKGNAIGGIAGKNNGTIGTSSYGGDIFILSGYDTSSAGGIAGYNYGVIQSSNSSSTCSINYTATITESKTLAPRMGKLVGENFSTANSISGTGSGIVNVGTLHTVTWTERVWQIWRYVNVTHTWNQAQYATGGNVGRQY